MRGSTALYGDESDPASPTWRIKGTNGGRFSTLRGGIPIEVDGNVVGAIGVGSGTGPQDVDVAEHAIQRTPRGPRLMAPAGAPKMRAGSRQRVTMK